MDLNYTYKSSIDYIESLKFDYIETYFFQRGIEFEKINNTIRPEYESLKERLSKQNDITLFEEKRFAELNELFGIKQYLINRKGEFHSTSIKTHTFLSIDPEVERLKNILSTEISDFCWF